MANEVQTKREFIEMLRRRSERENELYTFSLINGELIRNDDKYRKFILNTELGIWAVDREGLTTFANPYMAQLLGYRADEMPGKHLSEFMEEEGVDAYIMGFDRGKITTDKITTDKLHDLELLCKDGTKIAASVETSPFTDNGGAFVGMVAFVTRRVEYSEAERALLAKTGQLTAVTDAMKVFLEGGDWRQSSGLLLNHALRQTHSEYGFIGVVMNNGSELRIFAHKGLIWDAVENREFYEKAIRSYNEKGYLLFTSFDNLFGRVITTGDVVISNDPKSDSRSGGLPPGHPPLRHFLGVPILKDHKVVGLIGVANRPGGYTGDERDKIEILSQTVSVLYDNYRRLEREAALENERRKVTEQLRENLALLSKKSRHESIISTITRSVHKSIKLQDVLENAAASLSENLEDAHYISIYMVEGGEPVNRAYRGYPGSYIERLGRVPRPEGLTWKTIVEDKSIYCADIERSASITPSTRGLGTKSYLSMPIHSHHEPVGVIAIESIEEDAFSREEIRLLEIVAQQLETAINNAQQAETLKENEEKYRALYEENPSMYFTLNPAGIVVSANKFGAEQLGYAPEDLLGKPASTFIHPDDLSVLREQLERCLNSPGKLHQYDLRKIRKDGRLIWVKEYARALKGSAGDGFVLIVCEDITERKFAEEALFQSKKELEQRVEERTRELAEANEELKKEIADRIKAEEQAKKSLSEKEVLLREIHHRVKNNLQIITSLLNLQSRHIKSPEITEMFQENHNRIKSMALIHELLYGAKNLMRIDSDTYLRNLVNHLTKAYGVNRDIVRLVGNKRDVFLDIDAAIPCGLIINELVSNAFKHAFSPGALGEISIDFHEEDSFFVLSVVDNGRGLPAHIDILNPNSLGLQLVNTLVKQLDGEIELMDIKGTGVIIKFKQPN